MNNDVAHIHLLPKPLPRYRHLGQHPIHILGVERGDGLTLACLVRAFLDPDEAAPWTWPMNAQHWGMREWYPGEARPTGPKPANEWMLVWSYTHGMRWRRREKFYPAFLYAIPGDYCDSRRPSFIFQWIVDWDEMEAILGACWQCVRAGIDDYCMMRGMRLAWDPNSLINPAGVPRLGPRPFGDEDDSANESDDDFINDDSDDDGDNDDEEDDDDNNIDRDEDDGGAHNGADEGDDDGLEDLLQDVEGYEIDGAEEQIWGYQDVGGDDGDDDGLDALAEGLGDSGLDKEVVDQPHGRNGQTDGSRSKRKTPSTESLRKAKVKRSLGQAASDMGGHRNAEAGPSRLPRGGDEGRRTAAPDTQQTGGGLPAVAQAAHGARDSVYREPIDVTGMSTPSSTPPTSGSSSASSRLQTGPVCLVEEHGCLYDTITDTFYALDDSEDEKAADSVKIEEHLFLPHDDE